MIDRGAFDEFKNRWLPPNWLFLVPILGGVFCVGEMGGLMLGEKQPTKAPVFLAQTIFDVHHKLN